MMRTSAIAAVVVLSTLCSAPAARARDYNFDGRISRPVLENYLSRAITFGELLNIERVENSLGGDTDDNIRMLTNIGAKFAGRAIYMWGGETRLPRLLEHAKPVADKLHAADPDIIIQAAAFEIVTEDLNKMPIPPWVFEAFDLPPEKRNFRYRDMLYTDGHRVDQWRRGSSVPDMSRLETRLWFYYLSASWISIGVEAVHFGQVEIMDDRDEDHAHWAQMLEKVRRYARTHARRHALIADAHVPSGGIVRNGRLLFDFHSFPLRIEEVHDKPQQGILKVGYLDSIFKRSKGGIAPSGWSCESLPYLVELDNWGASGKGGLDIGGGWCWGYDEICWFAHQSKEYRNQWLRYAWDWVRNTDPNGFLQMPGSRTLADRADGKNWYWANTPSKKCPTGFDQEKTIKQIWAQDN